MGAVVSEVNEIPKHKKRSKKKKWRVRWTYVGKRKGTGWYARMTSRTFYTKHNSKAQAEQATESRFNSSFMGKHTYPRDEWEAIIVPPGENMHHYRPSCPNCGGTMLGDGLATPRHCERVDTFGIEPDAGPLYCHDRIS